MEPRAGISSRPNFLRPFVSPVALCLALACSLSARDAVARTMILKPDGTGSVPTFQAGVDSLFAIRPDKPCPDTLRVEPGFYDEDVALGDGDLYHCSEMAIVCPGGPGVTTLRSLKVIACDPSGYCEGEQFPFTVKGLHIAHRVVEDDSTRGMYTRWHWEHCEFSDGFASPRVRCDFYDTPRFLGCTFRRGATYRGFDLVMDSCRFIGAPIRVEAFEDFVSLRHCIFEGPVDTAVVARDLSDGNVFFHECLFRGARIGVQIVGMDLPGQQVEFSGCRFEDIADAAVNFDDSGQTCDPIDGNVGPGISESHFVRCGTALRYVAHCTQRVALTADTVVAARSTAFDVVAAGVGVRDLSVVGGGGAGMILRANGNAYGQSAIENSEFRDNRGVGLSLEDTIPRLEVPRDPSVIGCRFEGNGGNGLRVRSSYVNVRDNLFAGNRGTGLECELLVSGANESILRNTSVLNGDHGIALRTVGGPVSLNVENNLVAANGAGGIRVEGDYSGAVQHNDAWRSGGAPYAGVHVGDGNLALDPRFCDPLAGGFHVQTDSPCAPSGPFGQIGAFGVGCEFSRVAIDVDAGGHDKRIDLDSNALIWLTILSNPFFDPRTVDVASVRLSGASPVERGASRGPSESHAEDRGERQSEDRDGHQGLILALRTRDLQLGAGQDSLVLTGRTFGGTPIRGVDKIRRARDRGRGGHDREAVPMAAGDVVPRDLALEVMTPDAGHGFSLVLSLPQEGRAVLEMVDIGGRRVLSREVGSFGVGRHVLDINEAAGLPAGIYFLRLRQGISEARGRIAIVR